MTPFLEKLVNYLTLVRSSTTRLENLLSNNVQVKDEVEGAIVRSRRLQQPSSSIVNPMTGGFSYPAFSLPLIMFIIFIGFYLLLFLLSFTPPPHLLLTSFVSLASRVLSSFLPDCFPPASHIVAPRNCLTIPFLLQDQILLVRPVDLPSPPTWFPQAPYPRQQVFSSSIFSFPLLLLQWFSKFRLFTHIGVDGSLFSGLLFQSWSPS